MEPLSSPIKLFIRGLSLSLGGVIVAGNLLPATAVSLISQAIPDEEPPEVIIETEEEGEIETENPGLEPRFTCAMYNGQYTVMYLPESQPGQAYPWAVPRQLGGGWTPQKRCEAISQRLESYRPDGLIEMQTGIENNYETVCVTTEVDQSCRIVFTVPPGQNAEFTRDSVFENLATADQGDFTQGVNTFAGQQGNREIFEQVGSILNGDIDLSGLGSPNSRSNRTAHGLDLRPFLDIRDGGTGTQLRRGTSVSPSPLRLNPESFR